MNLEEINIDEIKEKPEKVGLSEGDKVDILIYKFTDLGIKVIIDGKYFGLVYEDDVYKEFEIGDKTTGYIDKIRHDNKIDVTLRKRGYGRIEDAQQKINKKKKTKNGFIPLNDDSSPESIKKELNMSKGTFKKAIGGLYKEKILNITDQGIELKK